MINPVKAVHTGDGGLGSQEQRGPEDHPGEARGRSGRESGIPSGRSPGQGRPLSQAALRRPLRLARKGQYAEAQGEGSHRGRAPRVYEGAHAGQRFHHPRRGPEHHARADEDVPDQDGLRIKGRRDGRRHPDRPSPLQIRGYQIS